MSERTYGVMSDIHFHKWAAMSHALASGVNSRLQEQINEFHRCCKEVRDLGGKVVFVTGDLFHVRGSVAPTVFNPVRYAMETEKKAGMKVVLLPGNHDLEGRDSDRIGSAVQMLEGHVEVIVSSPMLVRDRDMKFLLVPWRDKLPELREEIKALIRDDIEGEGDKVGDFTLMLHAPLNGVITGLPDHGLSADELLAFGFKRVFCGHHHNRKVFRSPDGREVWSVGALTHQTWGDVGSKAGFIIVNDDDKAIERATHAPEFVVLDASNFDDWPLLADGHYVKVTINSGSAKDIEETRRALDSFGAKGVVVISDKPTSGAVSARGTAAIKAGSSIDASISEFIGKSSFDNKADLDRVCQSILAKVVASGAEL